MASKLGRLVSKDPKPITISIYYRFQEEEDCNKITILSKSEADKYMSEGDQSVEVLKTTWRHYGWRVRNTVIQLSMSYNTQSGTEEFDSIKYQDNIIKTCLIGWNLTDDLDQIIDVTSDAIDGLPDQIVQFMLREYNKKTAILTEEEQKK